MRYTSGYHAECKHSKGRNLPKIGKDTLAVYATCKSPNKRSMGNQYFLDTHYFCESCPKFSAK